MSRGASLFGLLLGMTCLLAAITGVREPGLIWTVGSGIVLIASSGLALRGNLLAQGIMSGLGLLVLGGYLPLYFQTSAMWPYLAFVLLGAITLGLGVLGILLDRFQAR